MNLTGLSVLLLLAVLLGWWRSDAASGSNPGTRRLVTARRVVLVALAFAVHLNVFARGPSGGLTIRLPGVHLHDTFHYYLGTRYFAELGYTGLYFAALRASYEDDPSRAVRTIRDLRTNEIVSQQQALAIAEDVRARFNVERWAQFKRDLAIHREPSSPALWRVVLLDHGYNGTPLVTAVLGSIASQPWLSTRRFLEIAASFDLLAIGLLAAWLALRESSALALTFLFFTFANPLNDFSFVGASYLRYLHYLALAGALFALRRERLATSGALLAVAGWMRIFPLALYGCLLLRDLAGPGWRERLREGARLHAAFALATLAIAVGTSFIPTPDGQNPWLAFAEKLRIHADTAGANQISLATMLSYSPSVDRLHDAAAASPFAPSWAEEARRVRGARAAWVLAAAAGLLALCVAALRRAPRTAVLIPALLATFCVLPMTGYYWSALSLVALVPAVSPAARAAPLLLFAALGLTSWDAVLAGRVDLRYALQSAEVLAFLALATAWLWRTGGSGILGAPPRQ